MILIFLLWFITVQYSSLFQYFYQATTIPTLVENSFFSRQVTWKIYNSNLNASNNT